MGRYATWEACRRQGEVAVDRREETAGVNRYGRRQLGGRTDDLAGLGAATLPSPTRKAALEVKKEAENPIYELSAFCGGSGTWMPCPYCHALILCTRCQRHCPENGSFFPLFIVPATAPA
jgi:hypothetical protein